MRDVYEVDGDRLLLVATDRVSAYDVVMAEPIPMKGAVLTQMSAWWFRQLGEEVAPSHDLGRRRRDRRRRAGAGGHRDQLAGRAMLCRRGTVFPDRVRDPRLSLGLGVAEYAKTARWPARRCRRA